jgi:hypothetical protein
MMRPTIIFVLVLHVVCSLPQQWQHEEGEAESDDFLSGQRLSNPYEYMDAVPDDDDGGKGRKI